MDPHVSFTNLLAVAAIAFVTPLLLAASPARRLPPVVILIIAGIVLGPSGLGLVTVDDPIRILALLGIVFLLFLAGLDVDLGELRGSRLRMASMSLGLSLALALGVGGLLAAGGIVSTPVLLAVILIGTSVGIVIPILADAGLAEDPFGEAVIAAASVAEVASIVLLSVFFGRSAGGAQEAIVVFTLLLLLATAFVVTVLQTERSKALAGLLVRLQDTTAQIRVRGAWLLLVGFAALAEVMGFEVILGAFLAGATLSLIDADGALTHPAFRTKLEAIGFGVFVPVFFVATGLSLDVAALAESPDALARIPIFVLVLLVVRGVPAIAFRGIANGRRLAGAGLIQATLLPIAPAEIGRELGLLDPATAAALVTAGLTAVIVFPAVALGLIGSGPTEDALSADDRVATA